MPWWLAIPGLLMSLWQNVRQGEYQRKAIEALRPISKKELGYFRNQATANATTALARRGMLDSGLLPSAIAGIEPELARIRAESKRGLAPALSGIYSEMANQPGFLQALIPLALQYGVRGPGGAWWINPYNPAGTSTSPAVRTATALPGMFPWLPQRQPVV